MVSRCSEEATARNISHVIRYDCTPMKTFVIGGPTNQGSSHNSNGIMGLGWRGSSQLSKFI